jgi:hypothetical protein
MRIYTLFFSLSLILFSAFAQAQTYNLKGEVKDEQGNSLPSASVFLLQKSDSTLIQFVSTNVEGKFEFKAVSKGEHIVQVSFVGFLTKYTPVSASGDEKIVTIKTITLKDNNELGELTVEAEIIPIVINKDTVEYNAGAFKIREGDVAEDLLKKLPGVEVDKDGNIKAQGQTVDRVFVNGKEFFGDDPKVATKNLPAGTIKKVQVFDRKSDQAELSGIDDGEINKTINIELKDDAKTGAFGNVTGGYGYNDTDNTGTLDRYELKANINKFTKKTQFAFLGQFNNINQQGFSFNDYASFVGGFRNATDGGNMWEFNSGGAAIPLSSGGVTGLSRSMAGGLNLSHDFNKNTKLMSSYFYSLYDNVLEQNVFTENFLQEGSFISESNTDRKTIFGAHNVNLRFDHKIDTVHTFRLRATARLNDGNIQSNSFNYTNNIEGQLQNQTTTDLISDSRTFSYNASLLHSYKLKKQGRVLTTNLASSTSNNNRPLDLIANNRFFSYNPNFLIDVPLNQNQLQLQNSFNYDGRVTFTEPLKKKRYLEASYAHRNNNYESVNEFIDVLEDGTLVPNTMLSNNYTNDYIYDRVGFGFRQIRNKYNLSIGVDGQKSSLNGLVNDTLPVNQSFQNILPRLNFRYNFTTSKNFMMRYRTSVDEPSITQLQPVQNNTNPLNIFLGNQDLLAAYTNSLYLHYLSFSQFSGTSFYVNLNTRYTKNRITNATEINRETYARVTQPINVDYDFNVSSYASFAAPLKFMKAKFNLSSNNGYTNSIVFVNAVKDIVDRYNTGVDFSLENSKKDDIDLMVGVSFNQNISVYQVSSDFNQTYFNTTYFTNINYVYKRWLFNTGFDYNVYSGQAFADNQIIAIWNAYIGRIMLKSRRGELRLSAFDILNQNIGFSRTADLNFIQQERTNNLARYFMLSFTYRLNKMENPDEMKGGMPWGGRRRR